MIADLSLCNLQASRTKQNRWVKGRNNRVSKQVVVQRILPLQPGITQPFGVLATPDINNYPIDSSMIKPSSSSSSSVEYKSILTEENLSRMNHLSEDANSPVQLRSIDNDSSHSSAGNLEENSSTSEHQKCDSGIETCDMLNSAENTPEYSTIDVEPVDIDSDEEENNRIRQRFNEDPGIQSLMEISLPSPIPITHSVDECTLKSLFVNISMLSLLT